MSHKIILSSEEQIVCPECQHKFELGEGITRQTIEKYEEDFESAMKERAEELRKEAEKEAERKLSRTYKTQLDDLKEQLTGSQNTVVEMKARVELAQKDAKAKAIEEFEAEKKMFQQELSEKDGKLKELREQELTLRQEKSKLEEARRELELDLQRKLDEAKKAICDQIREAEAERFKMREAEYQKKIDDTLKANEDLRRKLEQGSQQLQGEVQELELEAILRMKFPFDTIEPVPKGEFGGDAIQKVHSQTGQQAGSILWESKRTKNWSDGWLSKLREDQRMAKADIAVIVSQTLPKDVESFDVIDGIWVTNPRAALPVATALRHTLLQVNMARAASEGLQTKTEMVYQYLTGPRFRQRVEAIVEAFSSMQEDLDKERKVIMKQWAKREEQIERVTGATVGMYGDLQGIAGKSLLEIEALELQALEHSGEDVE
uniref:DUF2130 domain-containing protein n=1 Tax=Candidatus Nitrotoga fabula TaxID=2182327 RepID=A0A2X0QSY2_9PROT|nr:conserved protein of unknown function [Candidatus Nitrotoga fabula]